MAVSTRHKSILIIRRTDGFPEIPDEFGGRWLGYGKVPDWASDVRGDINITNVEDHGYTYRINGIPITTDLSGVNTVAGYNTQIQFNNNGFLGAVPDFTYDPLAQLLSVGVGGVNSLGCYQLNGIPFACYDAETGFVNLYDIGLINGQPPGTGGPGGGTTNPGAPNHSVQFNLNNTFAGSGNFIWDNTNNRLGIQVGNTPIFPLDVGGIINSRSCFYVNSLPFACFVGGQINLTNIGLINNQLPGTGTGGVTSVNNITGAVTLQQGNNVQITQDGNTIFISSSGEGSSTPTSPGGPNRSVQFNNGGFFAGTPNLLYRTDGVLELFTSDLFDTQIRATDTTGGYAGFTANVLQNPAGGSGSTSNLQFAMGGYKTTTDANTAFFRIWRPGAASLTPDFAIGLMSPDTYIPNRVYIKASTGFVGFTVDNPLYRVDVGGDINVRGCYYLNQQYFACGSGDDRIDFYNIRNINGQLYVPGGGPGGGGTPSAPDRSVQFNSGGAFTGSGNFTYGSNGILRLTTNALDDTQIRVDDTGGGFAGFTAANDIGSSLQFFLGGSLAGAAGLDSNVASLRTFNATGATPDFAFSNYNFTSNMVEVRFKVVAATGFFGIGTNAPGYRLDVAGDVNSTGCYRINGYPFACYAASNDGRIDLSNIRNINGSPPGTGPGGGVTSLNNLTGAVNIVAGANVGVNYDQNDIIISSTGGGEGIETRPAGLPGQIQYHGVGGVFDASANFVFRTSIGLQGSQGNGVGINREPGCALDIQDSTNGQPLLRLGTPGYAGTILSFDGTTGGGATRTWFIAGNWPHGSLAFIQGGSPGSTNPISQGGTRRYVCDVNGNTGIGMPESMGMPVQVLDVGGNVNARGCYLINNSNFACPNGSGGIDLSNISTINNSPYTGGVASLNTLTGPLALTNGIGISVTPGTNTIAIANTGVTGINSFTGAVTITGPNVSSAGNVITISSGAGGGVTSLNTLIGPVNITNGQNITVDVQGQNIVITGASAGESLPTPPGGQDTQIQFNYQGTFGASPNFTWTSAGLQISNPTAHPFYSQIHLQPGVNDGDAAISLRSTRGGLIQDWFIGSGSGAGAGSNPFRIANLTNVVDVMNIDPGPPGFGNLSIYSGGMFWENSIRSLGIRRQPDLHSSIPGAPNVFPNVSLDVYGSINIDWDNNPINPGEGNVDFRGYCLNGFATIGLLSVNPSIRVMYNIQQIHGPGSGFEYIAHGLTTSTYNDRIERMYGNAGYTHFMQMDFISFGLRIRNDSSGGIIATGKDPTQGNASGWQGYDTTTDKRLRISADVVGGNSSWFEVNTNQTISMGTDSVQAIFISPGGGVGFANSNPVYRVDVNGDVRCTGSFIGGTPGGIWDFGARAQLNGRVFINYDSGDPTVTGPVALNLHGAFGGGLQFVDSFGERTVRLWTAVVPADAAPIFTTFNIGIGTSLTGGLDPEPLIIWSREIATGIRGTALPLLRNSNPGPGTRQIWYDPNDGNVVKYQP